MHDIVGGTSSLILHVIVYIICITIMTGSSLSQESQIGSILRVVPSSTTSQCCYVCIYIPVYS